MPCCGLGRMRTCLRNQLLRVLRLFRFDQFQRSLSCFCVSVQRIAHIRNAAMKEIVLNYPFLMFVFIGCHNLRLRIRSHVATNSPPAAPHLYIPISSSKTSFFGAGQYLHRQKRRIRIKTVPVNQIWACLEDCSCLYVILRVFRLNCRKGLD